MAEDTKIVQSEKKNKTKADYIHVVGRRREAVARVRLYSNSREVNLADHVVKKGEIFVNGKPIEQYFHGEVAKKHYLLPFQTTNTLEKFIATIKVSGGGKAGQLGAVVLGLARALALYDKEKFRGPLKKKRLLTRDARIKERRKIGHGGKARREKQSPKR